MCMWIMLRNVKKKKEEEETTAKALACKNIGF